MEAQRRAADGFAEVLGLMQRLRGPGGCPWDKAQTLGSLRRWLLEETYEVLEAIDAGDLQGLREELGDLLLQIVFQAQIASEQGAFAAAGVVDGLRTKLLERHPHVFGEVADKPQTPQEVSDIWEERKAAAHRQSGARDSALDGIPAALPALAQARRLQEKAARIGFEWRSIAPVQDKVDEELGELREAMDGGERARMAAEFGDVLFALVNLGRFLELDAEDCLRQANRTFQRRFQAMEREGDLEQAGLERLLELWEEAKRTTAAEEL